MRTLRTSEAAASLGVSPHTLRAWERRFGFPRPRRSRGNQRLYVETDIASLRGALLQGLSGASAISMAREPRKRESGSLEAALAAFDAPRADLLMDRAVGVHAMERTVEGVLLGTMVRLASHHGTRSAVWAFASRWASDWAGRLSRLIAPGGPPTVLVGSGVRNPLDLEALQLRALELLLADAAVATVTLPLDASERLEALLPAADVSVVVLAGAPASTRAAQAWLAAAHLTFPAARVAGFRSCDAFAEAAPVLPRVASAACVAIAGYARCT